MAKKSTFNPVKEETGDVRAKRIIWSTEVLNAAISGLNEGKKLKANPFYENDVKLLKADLVFERTPEEIEEWKKCRNDIVYFVEKYCKLMTPEGIQHVQLRDYQKKYLNHLQQNRLSIMLSARQAGKTTTTAVELLHYLCFNFDKSGMVCGNKRKTAVEILDKLKKIFVELPFFLRPGIVKWNEGEISFDNGCRCKAEATTKNSAIGETIHYLVLDEFAHVAPNIVEPFYNNIFPTIAAAQAKLAITSTQNGYNLFYKLYQAAVSGDSDYKPFKVDWYDIPEWDPEKKVWYKRDEKWKARQVANLGGEEQFNKQFGTSFDISAPTLISQKYLRKYQQDLVEFVNKDIPGVIGADSWYWHPDIDPMDIKKEFLIITCDLSEGIEEDSTVFSIYRMIPEGLECIGFFKDNAMDREKCALSLILFQCLWTNSERTLLSHERNTYGDVFLSDMFGYQDKVDICSSWDQSTLIKYYNEGGTKWKHGIKLTSGNKSPHCILFKESFERGRIVNKSTQFALEVSNFCDDGSGHYEATYGHDDMMMTAVQLEFVKETLQYQLLREDYESNTGIEDDMYNPYEVFDNQIPQEVLYDMGLEAQKIQYDMWGNPIINTNKSRLK